MEFMKNFEKIEDKPKDNEILNINKKELKPLLSKYKNKSKKIKRS